MLVGYITVTNTRNCSCCFARRRTPKTICKAPLTKDCDLRATFERPEIWPGRSVVAQTQKVLFLCNCYSTTLVRSPNLQNCCSVTTGRAKEAEWRQNHCYSGSIVAVVAEWGHSGRHSGRSMNAIGRPKEAQWWYKGGRSIAQIDTQCLQLYELSYGATNGRPRYIHSATTAMRVPFSCLLWATRQRPTSSATFVRLFWTCSKLHCDRGVHGEVWTSSAPPLNDQGNLSASSVPSTATWLTCAPRRSIVLQFFWHVDTRPISPFLFFFNSTFYLCIIIVISYLMYLIH